MIFRLLLNTGPTDFARCPFALVSLNREHVEAEVSYAAVVPLTLIAVDFVTLRRRMIFH
jgi:hypothetical protein